MPYFKQKIFAFISIVVLLFVVVFHKPQEAYANPLVKVVGSSALKVVTAVTTKAGVRGATANTTKAINRTAVKRLSKDGKVVQPELWIKNNKKAPTKKVFGGKFLKYTLNTASILSFGAATVSTIEDLLSNPFASGDIPLDYDVSQSEVPSNAIITGGPNWYINYGSTEEIYKGNILYEDIVYTNPTLFFYSFSDGVWKQESLGYRTSIKYGYFNTYWRLNPNWNGRYFDFVYSSRTNGSDIKNNSVMISSDNFNSDLNNVNPTQNSDVSVREVVPKSDVILDKNSSPVPDPNKPTTEIYIPNNPDAIEQIQKNPDMIYNPEPYVPNIPDGDPNVHEDGAGDPIDDSNGDSNTDTGSDSSGLLSGISDLIKQIIEFLKNIWEWLKSLTFVEWFSSLFSYLADLLGLINELFVKLFEILSNLLGPVLSAFQTLWDWLSSILDAIGKVASPIVEWLQKLLDSLTGFVTDIGKWFGEILEGILGVPDLILDGLGKLFVPDISVPDQFTPLLDQFKTKFNKPSDFDFLNGSFQNSCGVNDIYANLFGKRVKVFDSSFVIKYAAWWKPIMSGFMWFMFGFWAFRRMNMMASKNGGVSW